MNESIKTDTARNPRVTVLTVTYNSLDTIGATLDALQKAYDTGLADVVIVDNASVDRTVDFVEKNHPWVTLFRNRENVGYGRGCNCGFKYIVTPQILLLNPDAVVDVQALTTLVDFMDSHPRVGICGPAVKEESGALQPSGGLPTPWTIILRPLLSRWATRGLRHVAPGEAPSVTDWICGSIMLLRKRMIDEIGGFDPRFFLYFEETDLCYRAQQSGWEIWTVGEAVGEHVNAASAKATKAPMMSGTISEHYYRSRFYYLMKHFGWPSAVAAEIGELSFMFARASVDMARGRKDTKFRSRLRAPILQLPTSVDIIETKGRGD